MKKIQILGLALVAIFAFSAIAAASAFAESEWLIDTKVVTAKTAVTSEGTLKLCDDKGGVFGEKVCVECSGLDTGFVGPGKADEVTNITNLAGTSKDITDCKNIEACGTPKLVEAVNLPWPTEVFLEGAAFRDLVGSATKTPGYVVECEVFGVKVTDTCTGITSTLLTNSGSNVIATFEPSHEPGTCTRGGAGEGLVEGPDTNIDAGHTLAVS